MTESKQPGAKPPMGFKTSELQGIAKKAGTEYVKGASKEGGEQTVQYETGDADPDVQQDPTQDHVDRAQQQLDDAKAQAQGMWTKYCGCLSSA